MTVLDKLNLVNKCQYVTINKLEKTDYREEGFEIEHKYKALGVFITSDGKKVTYYRTNCYNSGSDWLEIDIDALMDLMTIVGILTGEN